MAAQLKPVEKTQGIVVTSGQLIDAYNALVALAAAEINDAAPSDIVFQISSRLRRVNEAAEDAVKGYRRLLRIYGKPNADNVLSVTVDPECKCGGTCETEDGSHCPHCKAGRFNAENEKLRAQEVEMDARPFSREMLCAAGIRKAGLINALADCGLLEDEKEN